MIANTSRLFKAKGIPSSSFSIKRSNFRRQFSTKPNATPSHSVKSPQTHLSTLGNKMRVASQSLPLETATVGVWIDAGSAFESSETNGAAHFLEHMSFKGTSNRTRQQLEVEIENIGGSLNAYTSRENTVYYTKVLKKDVPKAVDILADILLRSNIESGAVEAERSTILREMQEINKDNQEVVFDYLHAAAFQGHSLSRTILGPPENVQRLKRDDLKNYIKDNYVGPKMVLVGAGGVNHNELVDLANKSFGSLESTSPSLLVPPQKPVFTGSLIQERDDGLGAAHVAIAFESVGWNHPDFFTFQVLQSIIGSWDRSLGGGKNLSSRLCELVATEELVHSLSSFNTTYNDTGLFGAYFVNDGGEKLEDGIFEVMNEFNRISKNVSEEEVDRAKNKLKAAMLMQLDGTTPIAEDIGRQILTSGRRLPTSEAFAKIDSVRAKDVQRVIKDHFEDQCPAIAAVGKTEELPDYNQIRGWTYWMRW